MNVTNTTAGPALIGIYLNDHLAGATSGVELARRAAGSQRGSEASRTLRQLAAELSADRAELIGIMTALGVPIRHYKVYAGWVAEKVGRAKLNGRLLGRSPLSDVVELEGLRLAVAGKAACWRTLRMLAERDERLDTAHLDGLLARARAQSDSLEDLRVGAVERILRS